MKIVQKIVIGAILYQNITRLHGNGAIGNYTYLQWVVHIGLNLENIFNNI